jgi:hypothetical protein
MEAALPFTREFNPYSESIGMLENWLFLAKHKALICNIR